MVAGTEISVKELKARIDHLYQVKERATADDEVLRKQGSAKEALPALIAAERQRTDAALAKLEEALRQEDVAERPQPHVRSSEYEGLEQHSSVALDVTKVLANDVQRLGQEVAEAAAARRSVEEGSFIGFTSSSKRVTVTCAQLCNLLRQSGMLDIFMDGFRSFVGLREQLAQTLKRLDQAKESQHKQDASMAAGLEELRCTLSRSVTSEAAARELHFGQLQKANKGIQRAATKVAEDLRVALRDETRDREELRGRLEQHMVDVREALGDDVRSRKERDQQVYQAFEELRRELTSEASERRGAAEGLIGRRDVCDGAMLAFRLPLKASSFVAGCGDGCAVNSKLTDRLQHIEATIAEEAASREELGHRLGRDLVQSQARLQEEKVLREESLAKLEQAVSVQAEGRHTLDGAFATHDLESAMQDRDTWKAGKFQSILAEQQMEREERSRLLRDVNVSLAKLQRMQAEEEDTRNQEHERLGGALESLQEASFEGITIMVAVISSITIIAVAIIVISIIVIIVIAIVMFVIFMLGDAAAEPGGRGSPAIFARG
ncbi:hypothetical protein AK812_SmicGene1579 [Symbiodinium microadriaticum]|uniref:Uncharacterized protein n=1 Tax=Symbiodinium microadriaticum TaxID=2951 RepID=A0A1Q9F3L9_SYMMI|nr:hypothetical protein AK812_SmicGene1579 [Symbiodinium microadriaticum]